MKIEELRAKSIEELKEILATQKEKLSELSFKISVNQLKTVNEVSDTRRLIARISTILQEGLIYYSRK